MRSLLFLLASAALSFGAALSGNKITTDGTYTVSTIPGQAYVFAVSGTFGGGSLAINWNNGSSVAYTGSPATAAKTFTFTAAAGTAELILTGATNPDLTVGINLAGGSGTGVTSQDITSALGFSPLAGTVKVTYSNGTVQHFTPTAATAAANTDALELAWASANATSGAETVDLFPADFYLDTAPTTISGLPVQFVIETGRVLRLNGARLYHTATEQSYIMFAASLGTTNLAHDWAVFGPGVLEGTVTNPSGIFTTSDTATGEVGIHVAGASGYSFRYWIHGVTMRYFKYAGILCNSANYPSFKFTSGRISNCVLDYNIIGAAGYAGHEFVLVSNTTASYCKRGFSVDAGNWYFENCQASATTGDGLYVHSSGNNAHGVWSGGTLAHNYVNAVRFAPGVTNGWTFKGAHLGGSDGTTLNKAQLDGYGIMIDGGQWDCPIVTTAVNSGWNSMTNVFISNAATATVSGMFSGSRIKLKIEGCKTATGMWTHNDLQTYTFADNTAALAGGLTAGEKYKDSSGNVKVVY